MDNELNFQAFIGITYHFGGGKPSYYSGTAGVGATYKMQPHNDFGGQGGVNVAINFYNGGLGALPNSDKWHVDTVLSASVTAGSGKGDPMSIRPLHLESGTGMNDTFYGSFTLGSSYIINNDNRNQQVGFIQLRMDNVSFQTYNDVSKFGPLSDTRDRWWTGGGSLTIGANNSDYQLIIGADVFTADTNNNIMPNGVLSQKGYDGSFAYDQFPEMAETPDSLREKVTDFDYIPNLAGELDQKYLDRHRGGISWNREMHSFDLNQGRTSFRLRTPYGEFGINSLGKGNMYPQDIIHRVINFHLIPSTIDNNWEFSYRNGFNDGR